MVYLDTNAVIYLLENNPKYGHQIAQRLSEFTAEGEKFVSSTILVTEFLAGTTGATYKDLAQFTDLTFVDVSQNIARKAADHEREHGLVLGDAIHLATATEIMDVSAFITYDRQLAKAASKYVKVVAT